MNIKQFKDKFEVNIVGITMPTKEFLESIGIQDIDLGAQELISYQARVSNPNNQESFETADGLLAYCARHGHWSVFDMVNMVLEIKAPRDISRQILRHSSARFQEFSQRYADVTDDMFCLREMRFEDTKNRQNSLRIDIPVDWYDEWLDDQEQMIALQQKIVKKWRDRKVAKECTRVFWSEGLTMSNMYMNGTARTWIHYTNIRGERGVTQDEHCDIADACKQYLLQYFPALTKVLAQ